MASKQELMEQFRKAQKELFPVATHKLRKHELAAGLAALEALKSGKSAPKEDVPVITTKAPRTITYEDDEVDDTVIRVPKAPPKRLTERSHLAEKEAYRASIGAPLKALARPGRPVTAPEPAPAPAPKPKPAPKPRRTTATALEEAAELFPGLASHAAAKGGKAVEEHDSGVYKLVKPNRGKGPSLPPVGSTIVMAGMAAPAPAPTATAAPAHKPHRCNCAHCDKRGTTE